MSLSSLAAWLFPPYLLFIAYLVGSIPTGVILALFFTEIDVREAGSRNIGATNVARLTGRRLGALTLLGDALKGYLCVRLALALPVSYTVVLATALAAFLGHCYSAFLEFRGGKGVAVAFGTYLALAPSLAFKILGIWLLVFVLFRKSSLGALLAALFLLATVFTSSLYQPLIPLTAAVVTVLIARHRENISRLLEGREK